MKRKMSLLLLSLVALVLMAKSVYAAEIIGTGNCGPKVKWTLTDDGVLTINGEGSMWDYNKCQRPGWEQVRDGEYEDTEKTVITKIVVEEGVTTIGASAFKSYMSGDDGIIEVVLPSSMETIGRNAFGSQHQLQSVTIADYSALRELGSDAFAYCTSLKEMRLPEGLKSIGGGCFGNCSSLAQLNLPDSVEIIGEGAFYSANYHMAYIPWVVNQINDKQVLVINGILIAANEENCIGTVVVPEGTKSIGGYVDYSESIGGRGVFEGFEKITKVVLPNSLTRIGARSFVYCQNLEEVVFRDKINFIGSEAFWQCVKLTTVEIPDGVKYIGISAFADCSRLESVKLPSSLESIENGSFSDCDLLTRIVIPEGVKRIEEKAFAEDSSLREVVIPQSVEYIGAKAFYGTEWIANLYKDGMAIVHGFLLDADKKIETKNIPEGISAICGAAFSTIEIYFMGTRRYSENNQLIKIGFPSTTKIIDNYAFEGCVNLTDVIIPEGVKEIGDYAFNHCENMGLVHIPKSVKKVGYKAFSDTALAKSFEEKPFIVDGFLLDGKYWDKKGDVILPADIRFIADGAFRDTEGITSIWLLEGVEYIGSRAFAQNNTLKKLPV